MRDLYLLAGDIGGTKTLLQAAAMRDGTIAALCEVQYDSRVFDGLPTIIADFLKKPSVVGIAGEIGAAGFAVAGPVSGHRASLTNLPWMVDAREVADRFGIPRVRLLNDFEAAAAGIEALGAGDLSTLQAGSPEARGMRVVLGAGTGLGVAWLIWQGGHYRPLPAEAGHMDFAPRDELQAELLFRLRGRFGRVSYERVLSGAGLVSVYTFLRDYAAHPLSSELAALDLETEGAAAITDWALNRSDPMAMKALDMFIEVYGAFAGNLALAGLTRGGVYVAGGIAPKIIARVRESGFMRAFVDKGRFSGLMATMPVHVVMNAKVGLLGAALTASRL